MDGLSPQPKTYGTNLSDSGIEIAAEKLSSTLDSANATIIVQTTGLTVTNTNLASTTASTTANSTNLLTKLPKLVTTNTPSRSLNVAFQPSTTNPCLVFYTVELTVAVALLSPQDVTVDILSDSSNPPVSSQGQAKLQANQLLGLSVGINTTTRQQLVAYVPTGNYVKLTTSGTGTATLVSQLELEFTG